MFSFIREKIWYLFFAALALACAGGGLVVGQGYFLPPGATVIVGLGAGTGTFRPEGIIYTATGTAGGAATTVEQTLGTFSLPANSLDTAGRRIRIVAMFSKAANTDQITGKLYWAGTSYSSGSVTSNATNVRLQLDVVQSSFANVQVVTGVGWVGTGTQLNPLTTTVSGTQANAQTIQATCTQGSSTANDCVLQDLEVEFMN
jgi:hypothetical protein